MLSRHRHQLFHAGFTALSTLKADRWLSPVARGLGLILTFHHVRPQVPGAYAPNALLSITPDFLDRTLQALKARGFDLISLDAVPARLRDPEPSRPFAVLTFDDGYRDNAAYAAPVLARHGAPWTLFVTADFADGRGRLWWVELEQAIGRLGRVHLPSDAAGPALDVPARDLAITSSSIFRPCSSVRLKPSSSRASHMSTVLACSISSGESTCFSLM